MARTPGSAETLALYSLVVAFLRAPTIFYDENGTAVFEFDPPLSVAEQATLDGLRAVARSHVPGISPTEWQAITVDLATMRAFRQQTQAAFIALTQNQRDRALFDAINAQTNVLRALLRDG
jgi:hypothetical protein